MDGAAELKERCEAAEVAAADRLEALERVHNELERIRGRAVEHLNAAGTDDAAAASRGLFGRDAEKRLIHRLTAAIRRKDMEITRLRARLEEK
jgi:hypothetical protein